MVKAWDDAEVLSYFNESVLKPLDDKLALTKLDETDPAFVIVEERAKVEETQHGLPSLRQARDQLLSLFAQEPDPDSGELLRTGALVAFETAIETLIAAQATEEEERTKAASAIFSAVSYVTSYASSPSTGRLSN